MIRFISFTLWLFVIVSGAAAVNTAPTVTSTAVTTATEDSAYSYSVTASDTDTNDVLTWGVKSGSTLPTWLTLGSGSTSATTVATGLTNPAGMAIDGGGNIYVAEVSGNTIYKITPGGTKAAWSTNVATASKYGMLVVDNYIYIFLYCHNSSN